MRNVGFTSAARRQLRKLPEAVQAQVRADLAAFAERGTGDIVKLTARKGLYRLRSGSYRVVFALDADLIGLEDVSDRKDTYR